MLQLGAHVLDQPIGVDRLAVDQAIFKGRVQNDGVVLNELGKASLTVVCEEAAYDRSMICLKSRSMGLIPRKNGCSPVRISYKVTPRRIYNGGPVTVELSDSVFRNEEGVRKVAMLVRSFARQGRQQLQINSLRAMTLLTAKENPEKYPNLIVQVWGWSGYFCELAPEYQDHIIKRCLYNTPG